MPADLRIMRSNGGVATATLIARLPVLTLLSGPAAGVLGGGWAAALSGRRNLITFDVGGTSADIGIIRDGGFVEATARDTTIGGYPVLVPMIDVHTIGAGGGSIAHVDAQRRRFQRRPAQRRRHSGSRRLRARRQRSRRSPTPTSQLGRLDADHFLGGGMRLDGDAAAEVIGALATRLGLAREEAAEGVLTVLNANMANAIRSRTVEKGLDPRHFTLVAFGGAGPLHGAEVAAMLGIPEVLVPRYPGIASAIGLMTTDPKYDTSRTMFGRSDRLDLALLAADFAAMHAELAGQLRADGIDPDTTDLSALRLICAISARATNCGLLRPTARSRQRGLDGLLGRFSLPAPHRIRSCFPGEPVEIVNLRLTATSTATKLQGVPSPCSGSLAAALVGRAPCVFRTPAGLRSFDTPRYERDLLPLEQEIAGPAIILQADSTTIVPPQAQIKALDDGNLIIRFKES